VRCPSACLHAARATARARLLKTHMAQRPFPVRLLQRQSSLSRWLPSAPVPATLT
jgi:hypothetical protein